MRLFYYTIAVILAISTISCKKEEVQPIRLTVTTLAPTDITENGATFNLEYIGGSEPLIEYGFTWIGSEVSVTNNPSANSVSIRAEYALPIGTIQVQAYVKTATKTVLGESISFASLGGRAPTINTVQPTSIGPGDTLKIFGIGFSNSLSVTELKIGSTSAKVLETSSNLILALVPSTDEQSPLLTLRVLNNEVTYNMALNNKAFKITDIHPKNQGMDKSITIIGANFLSNISETDVILQKNNTSYPLEILQAYEDSLIVKIANFPYIDEGLFDVTIKSSNQESTLENIFKFEPPRFNIEQGEFKYCDTIVLHGQYFSPVPENNIIEIGNSGAIEILSTTPTSLKFTIDKSIAIQSNSSSGSSSFIIFENKSIDNYQNTATLDFAPPTLSSISIDKYDSFEEITVEFNGAHFPEDDMDSYNFFIGILGQNFNIPETQITQTSCDQISVKINENAISPGLEIGGTWQFGIQHADFNVASDVAVNLNGPQKPITFTEPTCGPTIDNFCTNNQMYRRSGNELQIYDSAVSAWRRLSEIPIPSNTYDIRQNINNDKITFYWYAKTLGYHEIWEYDIPTDEWSDLTTNLVTYYSSPHLMTINDEYYITGRDQNSADKFFKYDTISKTWIDLNDIYSYLSGNNYIIQSHSFNDKTFIHVSSGKIIQYNPNEDVWTEVASHQITENYPRLSSETVDDKIFIMTDDSIDPVYSTSFYLFDINDNSIELLETRNNDWSGRQAELAGSLNGTVIMNYRNTNQIYPYTYSRNWAYHIN